MVKKVSLTIFLLTSVFCGFGQKTRDQWVDSVFATLGTEEKIGQLLMLRASPSGENAENLFDRVRTHAIGGIIIMDGGPIRNIRFINEAQRLSRVPMLVGVEAGLGVGQTFDSIPSLPPPLALSAAGSDSLVQATGREIARQMKLLGLHINFTPRLSLDFHRSSYPGNLLHFSDRLLENPRARLFVQSIRSQGVLVFAQHTLEIKRSESPEEPGVSMHPYKIIADQGVTGILTTHLQNLGAEKLKPLPPALAHTLVSEPAANGSVFDGLTLTDVPYLKSKLAKARNGETEYFAFLAGNDILVDPQNISATIKRMRKGLKKNKLLQEQLDRSVRKVLASKYDAGLSSFRPIVVDNLLGKLNSVESALLRQSIATRSVTLLANNSALVPVVSLENRRFASISVGVNKTKAFHRTLSKYTTFDHMTLGSLADTTLINSQVIHHDIIVVGLFEISSGDLESLAPWLLRLQDSRKVIVCHFGDPRQLARLVGLHTVIAAYQDKEVIQAAVAQIVFGALPVKGQLPVGINDHWPIGTGASIGAVDRLSYGLPEEAGMDSRTLEGIRDIADEAIQTHATPGCYVLVARNGKVVFDQAFGWLTYEDKVPVDDKTIYDLASLSKVSATLQAVMFLHEKRLIDMNKKASVYLPELRATNKKDITIKDILMHQSGLVPFMLLYPETVRGDTLLPVYYNASRTDGYPFQVAPGLFASQSLRDSVWHWILSSNMLERQPRIPHVYRYSDLGLMILHRLIEQMVNQPMEDFLQQNLYDPIGAGSLGYLPLSRFPPSRIAPTERDTVYRKSLILGTVHDERAAMLGGIAGHAGLFGTATDLAKLGQMLLNGGHYGGIQFFKKETIDFFTTRKYETSRRGLGWDKPVQSDWNTPTSTMCSPLTFGHTGFTGTCIWMDPAFNLVYVFLSNCRYPDRSSKLITNNIRSRIQDLIYESIFKNCQFSNP